MKNALNRYVPEGYVPFESASAYKNKERKLIAPKKTSEGYETLGSIADMFDRLKRMVER